VTPAGWHPLARRELFEAADFYEARVQGLGEAFLDVIEEAVARVRRYPAIGSAIEPDLRQFTVRRFPYSVIYDVGPDRIFIVAVARQERRPRYWAARLVRPR
jgi:hypothetical protein